MKYVDFRKFTDENGAQPIYVFEGEEVYFREKGETLLKSKYVQQPILDYVAFEGNALKGEKLSSLVAAASSFPFASEKRFVKVSEFYPTEKDYETYLKKTFENPPQDSILLIVNSAKPKTGQATLSKKPNVTHVDCGRADEETIKKWIYVTCKRAGVYADGVTCGKLAGYCTYDMARIAKETEKLLTYCQAESVERLTDELVDDLVYPDAEYKLYELTDALARKNYSAYIKILNEFSVKGFNELSLLSSVAAYFKTLYETSVMAGSDAEIATVLGSKEFIVRKNRSQAAKFAKGELLRVYEGVYGAISDIKCGNMTPASALKTVTAKLFFVK